jgi:hypothetical protein
VSDLGPYTYYITLNRGEGVNILLYALYGGGGSLRQRYITLLSHKQEPNECLACWFGTIVFMYSEKGAISLLPANRYILPVTYLYSSGLPVASTSERGNE